jgi:hypothetical protein
MRYFGPAARLARVGGNAHQALPKRYPTQFWGSALSNKYL